MQQLPWRFVSPIRRRVKRSWLSVSEAMMKFTVQGETFEQLRTWTEDNDGVHVLPILPNGRIVLVDVMRPNFGAVHSLEIPGGGHEVAKGLTHEESAREELLDETGYTAETLEPVFGIASYPSSCNAQMCIYFAYGVKKVKEPVFDPQEFIQDIIEIDLEWALALISKKITEEPNERNPFTPKIVQPATIIALKELELRRLVQKFDSNTSLFS